MSGLRSEARRVGLVGTGHFATTTHAPALLRARNVELAGVWGRDRHAATALTDRLGVASYDSFEAMLADVDTVAICVAPAAQPVFAEEAARRGRDLILEKPLGLTTSAARAVVEAVRESRVATVSHFSRLFDPAVEDIVRRAAADRLDALSITIDSGAMLGDSPYRTSPWRAGAEGALWDLGPHVVSLTQYAHGPIGAVRVSATAGRWTLEMAHIGGTVSFGHVSLTETTPLERIEILRRGEPVEALHPERGHYVDTLIRAIESLDDLPAGAVAAAGDIGFAARAVGVLEAAAFAARTGRWTHVDPTLVLERYPTVS